MSEEPMFETARRLKSRPPSGLGHWNWDGVVLRSVEFGLTREDAADHIVRRAESAGRQGWSYILG